MPFVVAFDLATEAGLKDLNTFLQSRSYLVGFSATTSDVALFEAIGKAPDAAKYPNVARYFNHIASLSADAKAKLPAGLSSVGAGAAPAKAAAPAAKAAPAPAAEEEDVDLFGDDADEAAKKASAAASKPEEKKKEKKVVVAKSSVIYEVKPLEAGQDMKDMEAKVRSIEMDGLLWGGEFKVVDVAFGIQKLIIQAIIEDEKISTDDLEAKLMAFEDTIQSVDLTSFNKVG